MKYRNSSNEIFIVELFEIRIKIYKIWGFSVSIFQIYVALEYKTEEHQGNKYAGDFHNLENTMLCLGIYESVKFAIKIDNRSKTSLSFFMQSLKSS